MFSSGNGGIDQSWANFAATQGGIWKKEDEKFVNSSSGKKHTTEAINSEILKEGVSQGSGKSINVPTVHSHSIINPSSSQMNTQKHAAISQFIKENLTTILNLVPKMANVSLSHNPTEVSSGQGINSSFLSQEIVKLDTNYVARTTIEESSNAFQTNLIGQIVIGNIDNISFTPLI
ncbi:hypothetical protein NE237_019187 [Protea cynaroides]|uniref:Uncharacterized protein n=1 Tax=Protea cynaroides TaxID=273540 RepID=A0A9Q0KB95_9MAGN|nr:hypothetical protein NE237_019187 [Protea cynaroides]